MIYCTLLICLPVALYFLVDWFIRLFKIDKYGSRHVFVTGCDSGFGRELVLRLDKMGLPVFAGCFTEDGRRSLAEIGSSRVTVVPLDVTKDDSIQAALETVRQKLAGGKDLWAVVNNAGVIGQVVAAEMCTKKEHQDCYGVNLIGPIEVSRIFLPLLRKAQGRLVNLTSCMGRCASEAAPYCVSKFGLEAFSDVVRREVKQFGVKVSLVEPGYMRTALFHVQELHQGIHEAYNRSESEVQAAYGKDYPKLAIAVLSAKLARCSPDTYNVVDALVAAITSAYPRERYVVGKDARFGFVPLSFLPTWIGDRLLLAYEKRLVKESGFSPQ